MQEQGFLFKWRMKCECNKSGNTKICCLSFNCECFSQTLVSETTNNKGITSNQAGMPACNIFASTQSKSRLHQTETPTCFCPVAFHTCVKCIVIRWAASACSLCLRMSEVWLQISVAIRSVDCNPVCNVMMRVAHPAW